MRISDWSSDVCSSDLDFYYSPAGTVHAIGAGITLIEVQQNVDLTYRLYDYGRPRDLHLDAGIAVSEGTPFIAQPAPGKVSGRSEERRVGTEWGSKCRSRW